MKITEQETIGEIKRMLRIVGLNVAGTRADCITRLEAHMNKEE